jgi:hypothetical protein
MHNCKWCEDEKVGTCRHCHPNRCTEMTRGFKAREGGEKRQCRNIVHGRVEGVEAKCWKHGGKDVGEVPVHHRRKK